MDTLSEAHPYHYAAIAYNIALTLLTGMTHYTPWMDFWQNAESATPNLPCQTWDRARIWNFNPISKIPALYASAQKTTGN
jgi:hypothetical protein